MQLNRHMVYKNASLKLQQRLRIFKSWNSFGFLAPRWLLHLCLIFFLEIPNFLSEDECDYIITLASENELMNSVAKGGLTEVDNWKFDPYSE